MGDNSTNQEKDNLTEKQVFEAMEEISDFHIEPYDGMIDLEDTTRFTKLELSSGQKMQVSALLHQLPQTIATGALANAYTVKFPAGIPHVLTALHQGGYGSIVRENGRIVGSASFYPLAAQAAVLGAFTVLSAVTGQYSLLK